MTDLEHVSIDALKLEHVSGDVVFIEKGYLTDEMINDEYLRWLYIAVTRAAKTLYLVNFESRFFE